MNQVPPFLTSFTDGEIAEVTETVTSILRSGRLVLCPHTTRFERAMAELAGTDYVVAVNSGSTALEVIFRAMEVAGRTVLVPTNTHFATAAAALYAGARVELYDSGLHPSLANIEDRLQRDESHDPDGSDGSDIAAVVVVHIGGYISPLMDKIREACRCRGVRLIEDAAHAPGSTLDDTPAGGLADAAAFSFSPTTVITTGEGGMITTNDPELASVARRLRDQGKSTNGARHVEMGNSWRMTEIGAALGLAQTGGFATDLARRRQVIDRYTQALTGGLWFPPIGPFPHNQDDSRVSGHTCIAMLPGWADRIAFRTAVAGHGVALGRGVYELPLHRQPVFSHLGARPGSRLDPARGFRRADDFADRHICLPLWRHMTDTDVDRVITAVGAALEDIGG